MPEDCTCNCHKPDSISFCWMNDNHTFIQLKGKNLKEIVEHAKKISKKSPCGMLCSPDLLKNGKNFKRLAFCVFNNEHFEENLKKWIKDIEKDEMAMELIEKGYINKWNQK